ncbi:hypothetical protein GY15_31020 [Delftia sp. 670]|nr:hypothetical protein GY15_31020 [Delftia sp. 670]
MRFQFDAKVQHIALDQAADHSLHLGLADTTSFGQCAQAGATVRGQCFQQSRLVGIECAASAAGQDGLWRNRAVNAPAACASERAHHDMRLHLPQSLHLGQQPNDQVRQLFLSLHVELGEQIGSACRCQYHLCLGEPCQLLGNLLIAPVFHLQPGMQHGAVPFGNGVQLADDLDVSAFHESLQAARQSALRHIACRAEITPCPAWIDLQCGQAGQIGWIQFWMSNFDGITHINVHI